MTFKHSKIDAWLARFEKSLFGLSTLERAELVLEMNSHIQDKVQHEGQENLDAILEKIGAPEVVARSFASTGGLDEDSAKEQRSSGTTQAGKFEHTTSDSREQETATGAHAGQKGSRKVSFLGGLIEVDENEGQLKLGDFTFNWKSEKEAHARRMQELRMQFGKTENSFNLATEPQSVHAVHVNMPIGKLSLEWVDALQVAYKAKGMSVSSDEVFQVSEGVLHVELGAIGPGKCQLQLPRSLPCDVNLGMGKLIAKGPFGSGSLNVGNGKIHMACQGEASVTIKTTVGIGKVEAIPAPYLQPHPRTLDVNVGRGKIEFSSEEEETEHDDDH